MSMANGVSLPELSRVLRHNTETFAADAGFAGVGSPRLESKDDPIEVIMAPAKRAPDFDREWRRRESNPRPCAAPEKLLQA
jgi:hypothetical protein